MQPAPPDDPENDVWVYDQSHLDEGPASGEVGVQVAPVLWVVGMAVVRAGASKAVQRSVVVKATSQTAAKSSAKRAMTNGGGTVKRVGTAAKANMRAHTASNLRHNLSVRTGHTRVNYSAHHRMPQQFRRLFKENGVPDIDNPKFALWWCGSSHYSNARAYNQEWKKYFDRVEGNPKLGGRANVLRQMERITRLYAGKYDCPAGTRTPV